MIDWYILDDDHNIIPSTTLEAAKWMNDNFEKRRVAATTLPDGRWISTVFLGLDHAFLPGDPPQLFETMVFPSEEDFSGQRYVERCSTWSQALAMHDRAVEWAIAHPDGEDDD